MIFGSLLMTFPYCSIVPLTWARGGSRACRHLLHSVQLPEQNAFIHREGRQSERVNLTCVAGGNMPPPGSSDTQRESSESAQHSAEMEILHIGTFCASSTHLPQRDGGHQRGQCILFSVVCTPS